MDLNETIRILELHNDHQKGKDIFHPELHEMQLKIVFAVDKAINYLKEKKIAQEQFDTWKQIFDETPYQFVPEEPKITLRDHFSGLAMQALVTKRQSGFPETTASIAYEIADEMIEVRNKTK